MKSWSVYRAGIKHNSLAVLNFLMQPLELPYIIENADEFLTQFPPIFVVGAPRSGTTVLYQLLCKHFNLRYIPNFVSMWYRLPIVASHLFEIFYKDEFEIQLSSSFGVTRKLSGPSEFAEFWYRWFPRNPQSATKIILSDSQICDMRGEIAGISKLYSVPLVFKNVVNSVRLIPIGTLLPSAVFLEISRDPVDTAQSILRAREKLYRDKNHWLSVKTNNYELIKTEPYWSQIPKQIFGIERAIQEAKHKLGKDRFYTLAYVDLCKDTAGQLKKIEDFFLTKCDSIVLCSLPDENLYYSTGKKVNNSDYQSLQKSISKLWL